MASSHITIKNFRELPGELSSDKMAWMFPSVLGVTHKNQHTFWTIYVKLVMAGEFIPIIDQYYDKSQLNNITALINVDSGIVGGKIRKTVPTTVRSGKNLGKINESNVFTQALRDAYSLYNKQVKKNKESKITDTVLYPPMLSKVYKNNLNDDDFVYVQRKYNGVRAVSVLGTDMIMYSRSKNIYPGYDNIKNELNHILSRFKNINTKLLYIDGELYGHGINLQDISGISRRERQGDNAIKYMIYDCFIPEDPELLFSDRIKILKTILINTQYCELVETIHCPVKQINHYYNQFLQEKYEGIMIRIDSKYIYSENNYHSKHLLKLKPVLDAEMEVVGFTTGKKGKAAAALMIICKTENNITFPVTPALELSVREELVITMRQIENNGRTHFENHWLGKKIIIEFDEYSKSKVPQRARTSLKIRLWD